MESENEEYNNSKVNIGSQKFNTDKNTELNKLIEEYQIATSKKNVYINREEIFREIFMTVIIDFKLILLLLINYILRKKEVKKDVVIYFKEYISFRI